MSKIIKIGPIHSIFESPFIINLKEEQGVIQDVSCEIGFSHRGLEGLALKKDWYQVLELVERNCGLCSHTHASCYCQAVEKLAQIKIPPRAQFLRSLMAELERLHSHLYWLDSVTETLNLHPFSPHIINLREGVMRLLEIISGNRVMFSINTLGGVRRDLEDKKLALKIVEEFKEQSQKLFETFDTNAHILAQTIDRGILTNQEALELGVVGPIARASGLSCDVRKIAPYDAYPHLSFNEYLHQEGDAFARILIHFQEIFEGVELIEEIIQKMPAGPLKVPGKIKVPAGQAIGWVEAPRGELFYFVASDGSDIPQRVKIRVPTFANLPALRYMLKGERRENLNLVLATIDPCFSCLER